MNVKLFVVVFVLLVKCINSQLEFTAFEKEFINDKYTCADVLFEYQMTTAVRCMVECTNTLECHGIFYFVGNLNCMGCASYRFQISTIESQFLRKKVLSPVYLGCFADSAVRVLNGLHLDSTGMTNEMCRNICLDAGFRYAGTQWIYNCFCGNSYNPLEIPDETKCDMVCSGNSSQICGGSYRLSIYYV